MPVRIPKTKHGLALQPPSGHPICCSSLENSSGLHLRRTSVRVKGSTKPPRSIRYVLSADRKLRRLSLRRIPVPAKKAKRAKKPTQAIRAKKSTRATDSVLVRAALVPAPSTSPRAILLGLIGVLAVAVLIAARQPSAPADVASTSAAPDAIALPDAIVPPEAIVLPEQAAASAWLETKKPVAPKPPATAAVAKSAAADASTEKTTAVESVRVMAIEPVSSSPAMETTPNAAAESTSKVAVQTATSVTITGCLANDDDTFLLKDTSGADAPKSRSWRSGFLKKRPATIELFDATNALRLPSYVGQRVAATGMLINHEMRAQSLQRVAVSCS